MIPETPPGRQPSAWQRELAHAITDPAELLRLLNLDQGWLPAARAAARRFGLRVPRGFIARMRLSDPDDPLLRQVLPLGAECVAHPGYSADPVADCAAMAAPGVLHKYRARVLLTVTGACAVHCRYCFRRHYPYGDANPAIDDWKAALAYIAGDDTITEVILSGGDPLVLPDRRLADLARRLATIPHLARLRLHTRMPIVLPERVDHALLDWLTGTRLQPVLVVHANHAQEIDAAVARGLLRLRAAGVTLLNQSVLLRAVNDDVGTLAVLSVRLFEAGVLPYYLHLLDKVHGAAHFDVSEETARRLLVELRARLPGYMVPRLVREVAGKPAKIPLV